MRVFKMQCTMQLVQILKYILQHMDNRYIFNDCKLEKVD